ncbi:MAG: GGDEF domain-containing protein [Wenzhouxiangella sp.]
MGSPFKPDRIRAALNRQNGVRQAYFTVISLPILGLLLAQELIHRRRPADELAEFFGVDALDPALFDTVVALRLLTMASILGFGLWSWLWRKQPEKLHWPMSFFILSSGALLSATAAHALVIRPAMEIFLLYLFIYCALFLMTRWLAWTLCVGSVLIYVGLGSLLVDNPAPSFLPALVINSAIMATLGLVICLQNYRSRYRELRALGRLNDDNRRLRAAKAEIEIKSNQDSLTSALNRRALDHDLDIMAQRQDPFALAMFDIDFFKPYNDQHGHQAGDRVLKSVVDILKTQLRRSGDRVYRYGGEEFVVVLPNTSLEAAAHVCENLRRAIESSALPHAHRPDERSIITISGGLAHSSEYPAADIIDAADRRLYHSKRSGRNQITVDDLLVGHAAN